MIRINKSWLSWTKAAFVRCPEDYKNLEVEDTSWKSACMWREFRMGKGVKWVLCLDEWFTALKTWCVSESFNSYCCLCCTYDLLEVSSERQQYGFPLPEGIPGTGKDWCRGIWFCLQMHQAPWRMCLCHQTLQEASGRILRWVSVLAEMMDVFLGGVIGKEGVWI